MKFQIKVKANSSRQEIQTDIDGRISKVFLKKPAKDGKANVELEKLLGKYFKAKTKIIKGYTSKTKIVEVESL
jgi:uncharacterized protein (TIGR00251 family)